MTFVDAIRTIVPEEGKMFVKGWDQGEYLYVDHRGRLVRSEFEDVCFSTLLFQEDIESLDWEVINE